MGQALNLKGGKELLASIRIINKRTNKPLTPILYEDTFRLVGEQNKEIYFKNANHSEFHLTIDILNTNKDKINKIDLLRSFQTIIIERNEIIGCAMVLEQYITNRGTPLMFRDERSQCFGEIKIGFDRVFGVNFTWKILYFWIPISRRRTETDGGGVVCDGTSRALLRVGRFLEKVRFKEISEIFYAFIKYDLGMMVV